MTPSGNLIFSLSIGADGRTIVDIDRYILSLGRITFLFGESGIGKSLINRALFGILDPEEFDVVINGNDAEAFHASKWIHDIQENGFFVFQEPSTHLHPLLTIEKQLQEGTLAEAGDEGTILRELWSGEDATALLGVYPKPYRPSGGEKQRILLAMAFKKIDRYLASHERDREAMFVFDEPTGSLDNRLRDVVIEMLFQRFTQRPFTAVVVSHDYSLISMVRRTHPELANAVKYRELAVEGGRLVQRDFAPEVYLQWIGQQKNKRPGSAVENAPVVSVDSDVRVFGRRLRIARDRTGNAAATMHLLPGTMTYLKAPSGTGKTTLVKMMMGLMRGDRFRMRVGTNDVDEGTTENFWRRKIWGKAMTMVFQHADEALNLRSSVYDTFRAIDVPQVRDRHGMIAVLQELFDPETAASILDKTVASLSGGQKQRLNLLRGFCLGTRVLILDEPLNGLDFGSSVRILEMLRQRMARGASILIISHNEEIFDTQVTPDNVYYLVDGGPSASPHASHGI